MQNPTILVPEINLELRSNLDWVNVIAYPCLPIRWGRLSISFIILKHEKICTPSFLSFSINVFGSKKAAFMKNRNVKSDPIPDR